MLLSGLLESFPLVFVLSFCLSAQIGASICLMLSIVMNLIGSRLGWGEGPGWAGTIVDCFALDSHSELLSTATD